FATIKSLDEFQLNELFRQIGQPNQKAVELVSLLDAQKGKKVELIPHASNPFTAIVRDENIFSFISKLASKPDFKLIKEVVDTLPTSFNKNEIYLDADKIDGELKIRTWQEGDRIHSIGMKGSQLISDII